ncbi:hypothetical protein A1O3_04997 [Capronia epimyces CBS 606.96]|uniref:Myb-like DNA-binding domain-containing protein n=1 Tax=Capronia epimyces CBS 606.96 TaxID=1182542 RepID=W9Y3X3_9EURO|nr:uncharacterized protein A1O3_04997 [Capronia epimyces CBS 606.96]EXJ84330.1 hypothetical protein A1O3_04997 [Capronia epimyces CBS 606.96]
MAPTSAVDGNSVFLYKCLQASQGHGRIDFHAVAAETGLTVGAANKRYQRLREKIERSAAFGTASSQNPEQTPRKPTTTKGNASLKRKADLVKDEELPKASTSIKKEPQDEPAEEEAVIENTVSKRQTRGRRLNYNTSGTFDVDSSRPGSVEDSEDDFKPDGAEIKQEEDEDDLELVSDGAKPASKRVKRNAGASTEASASPKSKSRNSGKKSTIRTPRKSLVVSEATAKCTMQSQNKPLPSIEYSPSATHTPEGDKRYAGLDGDIELKSLQPGTLITLPPKRQAPVWPIMSAGPSAGARSLSASSQDSAGKMLQRELDEADMIRPEDSISMVGRKDTPPSPNQSKFERIKGLLPLWKSG